MISVLSPLFLFGIAVIAMSVHVLLQTEECEYYKHVKWHHPEHLKMYDTFVISYSYTKVCTTAWGTHEEQVPYTVGRQDVDPGCPPLDGISDDALSSLISKPVEKSVKCE